MKKHLLFLSLAGFMLVGLGCGPTPSPSPTTPSATSTPEATSTGETPTPATQPTSTQPVINWKTYSDPINGYSFQYPQPASTTDWDPEQGPLDLSIYPVHEGQDRSLTLVTSFTTSARTGCGAYVSTNGQEIASGTPELVNDIAFCEYRYNDGAAGHTGSYFDDVTVIGNTQIVLSFLDFHVTDPRIYADCESGTSTETKCIPFDVRTDAQIFREILASFTVTHPTGYTYTTGQVAKKDPAYEINVTYPIMDPTADSSIRTAFNAAALTLANDQVTQFNTDYVKNLDPKNPESYPGTLDFNGVVKYQKTGNFISAFYTGSLFTNGAHPNALYATLLFDVTAKKRLGITDVLQKSTDLQTLAKMSRDRLIKLDTQQIFSDTTWLDGGTDPSQPQNFQFFYFTPQGMTIVFPPYQVAAYAAGPQQVSFTYADLKNIIKDRFLP